MAGHFKLLLKKCYLLKSRRLEDVILESVTFVFITLVVAILSKLHRVSEHDKMNHEEFSVVKDLHRIDAYLLYTPNSSEINNAMNCFNTLYTLKGFKNERELINFYIVNQETTFAAVQYGSRNFFTKDIRIHIRFPSDLRHPYEEDDEVITNWMTDLTYPKIQHWGPRASSNTYGAFPNYYLERFLTLQQLTAFFFINRNKTKNRCSLDDIYNNMDVNIKMKRFPYGKWTDPKYTHYFMFMFPVFFMISYLWVFRNFVKTIIMEREKQLKESMIVMGLHYESYWSSWSCLYFIYLTVGNLFLVSVYKIFSIFPLTDTLILFFLLTLYSMSFICFGLLVSTMFPRASHANILILFIFMLSFYPYLLINIYERKIGIVSATIKLLGGVGSGTAVSGGFVLMLLQEARHVGITWSNFYDPISEESDLTMEMIFWMLIADIAIYLILAFLIDALTPSEYDVRLPWCFLCTSEFWFSASKSTVAPEHKKVNTEDDDKYFEAEPLGLKMSIKIVKMEKVFKKTVVVNELNLNIFEDQVTVLLGHNGAGKTTTLLMLTGMITPTRGTAMVNGFDIVTNKHDVHKSMGVCFQKTVAFDDLTVAEQLYFFCKIKGLPKDKIRFEVQKYLSLMDLFAKKNKMTSKLPSNVRRRLSVAIALCGNSKIVLLDEPTTGMDPASRIKLRKILDGEKKGRTIVLTTHYMDEAQFYGDRIAVMAHGELYCCGSPSFLKEQYKTGYHLIVRKTTMCNMERVTSFVNQYFPDTEIHGRYLNEFSYLLPEDKTCCFEKMLQDLEYVRYPLGIDNYSISFVSLDEVFLKIGQPDEDVLEESQEKTLTLFREMTISTKFLCIYQIQSILMKRFLYTCRNMSDLLIVLIIPIFYISIFMRMKGEELGEDLPQLLLRLTPFPKAVTLVEGTNAFTNAFMYLMPKYANVHDIEQIVVETSEHSPERVRQQYIIGAKFMGRLFEKERIIVYFNNNPLHSPAIALGEVLSAISLVEVNKTIAYFNTPLPYHPETKIKKLRPDFVSSILVTLIYISYVSYFIMFYIKERVSEFKRLQYVTGVNIFLFWVVSFLYDLLLFTFFLGLVLSILRIRGVESYSSNEDIRRLIFITYSYAWCTLPLIYLWSHHNDEPANGYTEINMLLFAGLVLHTLKSFSKQYLLLPKVYHCICSFIPTYNLMVALKSSLKISAYHRICKEQLKHCIEMGYTTEDCTAFWGRIRICDSAKYYLTFEEPGIAAPFLMFLIEGVIFFSLLFATEFNLFTDILTRFENRGPKPKQKSTSVQDEGVIAENKKVLQEAIGPLLADNTLVLKKVTKYFKGFLAVKSVCLRAKKCECFGILGTDGAGKTTTFKMVTGELRLSSGNIWISGVNVSKRTGVFGYSPQSGGLMEDFTPSETLIIFGLMHGINYLDSEKLARQISKNFDFYKDLDNKILTLTFGDKKKVNMAVALLGDPLVILLDEPTVGMDMETKNYIWDILVRARNDGKCIFLTSQDAKECEAVCSRVAIMINGHFKCLDTMQHFQDTVGAGYLLIIKLLHLADGSKEIESFISKHIYAKLYIKDELFLTYYIPRTLIRFPLLFNTMERAKHSDLNVDNYSLVRSTLKQFFLKLSRSQRNIRL